MTHTMLHKNSLLVLEMSMRMTLILLVSLLLRSSAVGWQDGRLNLQSQTKVVGKAVQLNSSPF